MISDNLKISTRQFGRMVVLDWLAKTVLLLPGFAEKESGRSFVLSLLFGVLLALAYAWLVGKVANHMEHGFYAYTAERLGQSCARILTILYLFYAFLNTVFLVRMFGVIACTFVLPETPQEILMAILLLGSVYIILGGTEVRARVSEVLFSVLVYPLLFLLICAAFSTNSGYLAPGRVQTSFETVKHGMQVFIGFGGMGIFLFFLPELKAREKMGRTLIRAVAALGMAVVALCLAAIGSFGEAGMRALSWPAITLMSSALIPGGFLQRWDVIFTGLLLAAFFPAVGAGLYYMKILVRELLGEKKRREAGSARVFTAALLVYAAALWCASYATASRVFTVVNGYLLVPFLVLFTLFLAVVEYAGRRRS